MTPRYEWHTDPLAPLLRAELVQLIARIFGGQLPEEAAAELDYQQARTPLLIGLAFDGPALIGYKIGYERKPGHFYSWLGGVLPTYRGQGIASALMTGQHDWCRQRGYHTLRTQTYNQWRSMLILNLRHGFDIVGTVQGTRGLTIVLEKKLVH
ncbi:GNAT family N-acetyltransferase [Rudanella paleaurantiibacter]|uniref:GNAT family N-acetyltransferase n=1 Tax=Rudanella paleaurantiibacter TaxID=2614655 RepID=A0A7J5TRT5_9BACT|nr:GNAT family N-acetyltransferase [Rudanella paleaurantiibacter]KAB7725605.1 GNAT family N-acetyltransferase [Rudanella paleaurantiibacter]